MNTPLSEYLQSIRKRLEDNNTSMSGGHYPSPHDSTDLSKLTRMVEVAFEALKKIENNICAFHADIPAPDQMAKLALAQLEAICRE